LHEPETGLKDCDARSYRYGSGRFG
jgi:hypothetical protein